MAPELLPEGRNHPNFQEETSYEPRKQLMSVALRLLAFPPFPLERIEELTALMGGDGSL